MGRKAKPDEQPKGKPTTADILAAARMGIPIDPGTSSPPERPKSKIQSVADKASQIGKTVAAAQGGAGTDPGFTHRKSTLGVGGPESLPVKLASGPGPAEPTKKPAAKKSSPPGMPGGGMGGMGLAKDLLKSRSFKDSAKKIGANAAEGLDAAAAASGAAGEGKPAPAGAKGRGFKAAPRSSAQTSAVNSARQGTGNSPGGSTLKGAAKQGTKMAVRYGVTAAATAVGAGSVAQAGFQAKDKYDQAKAVKNSAKQSKEGKGQTGKDGSVQNQKKHSKLVPMSIAAIMLMLGIQLWPVFLVMFAVTGNTTGGYQAPDAQLISANSHMPADWLAADQSAGVNNSVPWPILAAIQYVTTQFGAKSPYETGPHGQTKDPPIGTKVYEGSGPTLFGKETNLRAADNVPGKATHVGGDPAHDNTDLQAQELAKQLFDQIKDSPDFQRLSTDVAPTTMSDPVWIQEMTTALEKLPIAVGPCQVNIDNAPDPLGIDYAWECGTQPTDPLPPPPAPGVIEPPNSLAWKHFVPSVLKVIPTILGLCTAAPISNPGGGINGGPTNTTGGPGIIVPTDQPQMAGATTYGGPNDPGTPGHVGAFGDLQGQMAFAELSPNGQSGQGLPQDPQWGGAMGNLPPHAQLLITNPANGKSVVAQKLDLGQGGGPIAGYPRVIDLWWQTADALGLFTGPTKAWAGALKIQLATGAMPPSGTPPPSPSPAPSGGPAAPPPTSGDGSPTIMGPSSLTLPQLEGTWGTRGQPANLKDPIANVIKYYYDWGTSEGVRGDIALAQAYLETGYFTNSDTARNNFAGIAHYNNAPSGQDFPTPSAGVLAQIQLLKEVVYGNGVTMANAKVAPNWGGRQASTWSGLTRNWATDPNYWNAISSIYQKMLAGAGVTGPVPSGGPGGGGDTCALLTASIGPNNGGGLPGAVGVYQNPYRAITNLTPFRIDQGVDYGGSGPLYALGNGIILNIVSSGWPGGAFISYRLLDGPAKDRVVYSAENITPNVTVGQQVNVNTIIGILHDAWPHSESGWGRPDGAPNSMAVQVGQWDGSHSTAYGMNFNQLLVQLGCVSGKVVTPVTGSVPPNWPGP